MGRLKLKVNWGEAAVPGLIVAFGLAYFLQVGDGTWVALRWPVITAAGTAVLSVLVVLGFVIGPAGQAEPSPARGRAGLESWLRGGGFKPALVFAATLLYVLVLNFLGFFLSTLAFLCLLFRGLGSRSWGRNFLVALIIAGFLHLALVVFMQMTLPRLEIGRLVI